MQIIVFGMHRSGTSLITRLVNMLGAYFGPEKSALGFGPDNPKGFWERRDVIAINDAILHANECTWDRLANWPLDGSNAPLEPKLARSIRSLVLDMDAHRPWVLKDPRLCMTFNYWKRDLEMPVCIIAHRDPLEVARSLEKRNRMPLSYGLAMWEYHASALLNATLGLPCIHVSHAEALRDPVAFTLHLKDSLEANDVRGLRTPSEREITAFVDPALHRAKAEDVQGIRLSPHQNMLVSLLTGEAVMHQPVELSEASAVRMSKGY